MLFCIALYTIYIYCNYVTMELLLCLLYHQQTLLHPYAYAFLMLFLKAYSYKGNEDTYINKSETNIYSSLLCNTMLMIR